MIMSKRILIIGKFTKPESKPEQESSQKEQPEQKQENEFTKVINSILTE